MYNEDGWKAALNECLTTICKDGNGKLIGSFVGGAIGGYFLILKKWRFYICNTALCNCSHYRRVTSDLTIKGKYP